MNPQVDQTINNKYRLIRLIGEGGMGTVWEARHELLGTKVALKFLHGMLAKRKGLAERFLQEAQVSARIKSPHVVQVSDVDRTPDGLVFMVMELIDGQSLQGLYEQYYAEGQRLEYGRAFDIMLQLCDGVVAAHELGIVHRDLKPDNVMLARDAKGKLQVKILDFGIAKLKASGEMDKGLTRPGMVMGTPEYMAPEQAFSADKVDARADVFSLGVMFFEMLAHRRPVGGDDAHAIVAQYLDGNVPRLRELKPTVAEGLAAAVHKAMAAAVEDRFASVESFLAAIAPYAPASSTDQPTPTPHVPSVSVVNPSGVVGTTNPGPSESSDAAAPPPGSFLPDTVGRAPAPAGAFAHSDGSPSPHRSGTAEMGAAPQPEAARRPGGTQMGDGGMPPMSAVAGPQANMPLAGMAPPAGNVSPYGVGVPAASPGYGSAPAGRRGGGSRSMLTIIGFAAVAAALVMGGLFLAQRLRTEEEPPLARQQSTSEPLTPSVESTNDGTGAGSDIGSPTDSIPPTEPAGVGEVGTSPPPTTTVPPTKPQTPTTTPPVVAPTATPTSAPTTTPTNPGFRNPWVIPSALPPIPGVPNSFPRLPGLGLPGMTQPGTPPPPPSAPPTSSKPSSPPIFKRIPRRTP